MFRGVRVYGLEVRVQCLGGICNLTSNLEVTELIDLSISQFRFHPFTRNPESLECPRPQPTHTEHPKPEGQQIPSCENLSQIIRFY